MINTTKTLDFYVAMAFSSLFLFAYNAAVVYQGGGLGLAFLASHCLIFITNGYVFGQSRRIKGTFTSDVFFPDALKNEGIKSQWFVIWMLHIYVAVIWLDFNTIRLLSTYVLSPSYDALLPLYKFIPIIDGIDEVYRANGRTLKASVISSIIVGCTVGTLIGGGFIARNMCNTYFSLSSIKIAASNPRNPMMKNVSILNLLGKIPAFILCIIAIFWIMYFPLFSRYFFLKTAVSPEYLDRGFSGTKYILFGRGVESDIYWFSYAWLLQLNLLVLFPALLRLMAAKVYITWQPRNS